MKVNKIDESITDGEINYEGRENQIWLNDE